MDLSGEHHISKSENDLGEEKDEGLEDWERRADKLLALEEVECAEAVRTVKVGDWVQPHPMHPLVQIQGPPPPYTLDFGK